MELDLLERLFSDNDNDFPFASNPTPKKEKLAMFQEPNQGQHSIPFSYLDNALSQPPATQAAPPQAVQPYTPSFLEANDCDELFQIVTSIPKNGLMPGNITRKVQQADGSFRSQSVLATFPCKGCGETLIGFRKVKGIDVEREAFYCEGCQAKRKDPIHSLFSSASVAPVSLKGYQVYVPKEDLLDFIDNVKDRLYESDHGPWILALIIACVVSYLLAKWLPIA